MTKDKKRHHVKSQWYYIFWGTCTVAVCAGQLFVGNGFRRMSESFDKVLDSPIELDLGFPRIPIQQHPMMVPDHEYQHEYDEDGMYYPTDPPQKIY